MRIEVVGGPRPTNRLANYAKYRVFAALTQFADAEKRRRARVVLRPVNRGRGCDSIACTVTVALEGADSFRIRTTGPHAYAAINRAVERINPRRRQDRSHTPSSSEACQRRNQCVLHRALCVGVLRMVRGPDEIGQGLKRAEHVKNRPAPTNRGRSQGDRHRASSSRLPSASIAPSWRNRR